jgi:hypothetical protein
VAIAMPGVAIFMDYVFNDPHAWEKMSESSRQETLKNADEWDVMMTTGTLFPEIDPGTIERITVPTLLLSGAKSYPFLALLSQDLARLLLTVKTLCCPMPAIRCGMRSPKNVEGMSRTFS